MTVSNIFIKQRLTINHATLAFYEPRVMTESMRQTLQFAPLVLFPLDECKFRSNRSFVSWQVCKHSYAACTSQNL